MLSLQCQYAKTMVYATKEDSESWIKGNTRNGHVNRTVIGNLCLYCAYTVWVIQALACTVWVIYTVQALTVQALAFCV